MKIIGGLFGNPYWGRRAFDLYLIPISFSNAGETGHISYFVGFHWLLRQIKMWCLKIIWPWTAINCHRSRSPRGREQMSLNTWSHSIHLHPPKFTNIIILNLKMKSPFRKPTCDQILVTLHSIFTKQVEMLFKFSRFHLHKPIEPCHRIYSH